VKEVGFLGVVIEPKGIKMEEKNVKRYFGLANSKRS